MQPKGLPVAVALAALGLADCARLPRIRVEDVALSSAADNHALALNFDGYADTGIPIYELSLGEFTLAARVFFQHPTGNYQWVFGEGTNGTFIVGKDRIRPLLIVNMEDGFASTDQDFPVGAWIHLALVHRPGLNALYLDGVLVKRWASDWALRPGRGTLRLGLRGADFPLEQLIGYLDDVWVLDEALPREAVQAMAAGAPPPPGSRAVRGYTFEPGGALPKLVGDARVAATARGAIPPPLEPNHRTELRLPFEGEWWVLQGSNSPHGTHRGAAAFSYDFGPVGSVQALEAEHKFQVEAQSCFGRSVLSPAAGRVTVVRDSEPDWSPDGGVSAEPNRILIEHRVGEISEFVHIRQHSARVGVGDAVSSGQPIADCGSSGTERAHLHWALLRSQDPVITRPSRFRDFEMFSVSDSWVGSWHRWNRALLERSFVRSVAPAIELDAGTADVGAITPAAN